MAEKIDSGVKYEQIPLCSIGTSEMNNDCLYSTKTVYCEQLNAEIVIRERNNLNQKVIYQFTEAVQVYNITVK